MKHKDQRVAILIDIQNLFYSAKSFYNKSVDYKALLKEAVGDRKLIRAIGYGIETESTHEDAFFDEMEEYGYEIKTKDLQIFVNGQKKGDWDVGIAVDAIKISQKVDVIILVSGDGDYIPLVEYLQAVSGCKVEGMAFAESASIRLIETLDDFVNLSSDTKKFLKNANNSKNTNSSKNNSKNKKTKQTVKKDKKSVEKVNADILKVRVSENVNKPTKETSKDNPKEAKKPKKILLSLSDLPKKNRARQNTKVKELSKSTQTSNKPKTESKKIISKLSDNNLKDSSSKLLPKSTKDASFNKVVSKKKLSAKKDSKKINKESIELKKLEKNKSTSISPSANNKNKEIKLDV